MSKSEEVLWEYIEAMTMGQNLDPHLNGQTIFVPGRAKYDWEPGKKDDGLLVTAAKYRVTVSPLSTIVVPGHDGSYKDGERIETGYPGNDVWLGELREMGIPNEFLSTTVVRPGHEKITHTREETDGFVMRAKKMAWDKRGVVIANPHQIPRLLACYLKSCQEFDVQLTLYPVIPTKTDWKRHVHGSLGLESAPRWQHIQSEITRSLQYIENGWMVPFDQLREYLLSLS